MRRAVVVDGVGDERLAATVRDGLSRPDEGIESGLLLMQLVSSQDKGLLTLKGLDGFATMLQVDGDRRDLLRPPH